jgi:hypothetical protein
VDEIASECEGNTLLHGEDYHKLEDEITNFLRILYTCKEDRCYA